jgi:transcriptional regulator with XRE-family HTH domain
VHTEPETLGKIIKSARQRSELTMEELAERIGITERYLYRIENEGKKPSYDILYKLIRELSISPDLIFYPEKPSKESEVENLIRMLYNCDERSLEVVKATAKALIGKLRENNCVHTKQKEPMNYDFSRSSALHLCVWLSDNCNYKIFSFN